MAPELEHSGDEPGSRYVRRSSAGSAHYAIRIKEQLDPCWSEWFKCMTVTAEEGSGTLLAGRLADQAALHGLLAMIRDLNLTLISVIRVDRV